MSASSLSQQLTYAALSGPNIQIFDTENKENLHNTTGQTPPTERFPKHKSFLDRSLESRGDFQQRSYDDRLKEQILEMTQRIKSDLDSGVGSALKADPASKEFLDKRITELVEDSLRTEKEVFIKKLSSEALG